MISEYIILKSQIPMQYDNNCFVCFLILVIIFAWRWPESNEKCRTL